MTISSDPRHGFAEQPVAGLASGSDFSQWPEPIGFGAAGDAELVREFGDIARQEYLAVGIHVALHPMADLATEPRWARIMRHLRRGRRARRRGSSPPTSAASRARSSARSRRLHDEALPGRRPADATARTRTSPTARSRSIPGGNFEYHLRPFEAAFAAGTAQIMPYYGRPVGTGLEEVGFGFNRDVITGLLRERYGFDGVVCTDWGLVTDMPLPRRLGLRGEGLGRRGARASRSGW